MMEVKSPGSGRSRHVSPAPKSPTYGYQYTVTPTPPPRSPLQRSPGCVSSPQIFNFPDPKSPSAPKSPNSLKSPKSPKMLPKSPRSPRSVRLVAASGTGSYPEIHSPSASDNYFNFNLPSPQKHYSHTKIVCQTSLPCGGPTKQRYTVKTTPSVEYKICNVDNVECNIRANPCYASSTSVNESDSSTGTRPASTSTSTAARCRRSTSDLTDMSDEAGSGAGGGGVCSTSVTSLSRPSSPRRRGSMKGGLAYLASRRGSRDSLASNVSNVSNEDIGPLNFQNTARGRQRRTSNFLELPVPDHIRPRVCSLPEKAYNPRLSDDLYRLRTFSITNKGGVVNCGDSIINRRSRSNTSVNSTASRASNVSGERSPFDGSCCGSGYHTVDSTPLGSPEEHEIPKYRVVLLGDAGVGKTALVSQFMTSEYMNTYDASLDDEFGEKTVSILLDAEESEMIFIDHPSVEMSVENSLSTYEPHACVVVYSITARESFQVAEEILNYLWRERYTQEKSVIVVGNKADLARSRVISANDGKALAVSRDCKFIETSSGIQHNVDELLVGILKQIRLRESRDRKQQQKSASKRDNHKLHGSKTSLSLNIAREILQKICMNDISKSKSCENLHVL